MGKPDPLVAALDAPVEASSRMRLDALYGDRPAVLAAILRARARGVSKREIARRLSTGGAHVSATAVGTWLEAQER